jgi:transposase
MLAEPKAGAIHRWGEEALPERDPWMLSEARMRRIEPPFPLSHGIPRVDDRRIVSAIIFVIRNGLRCRDAPSRQAGRQVRPRQRTNTCVSV